MCSCMQDLANEYSKKHHQNRRDAEIHTNVNINITIRPYTFDDKTGSRPAKHVKYADIPPKFCPLCGKKVHGYQEAHTKGGLVKV